MPMLSFKYRIYPSNKQQRKINSQLELTKKLYNHLLEKAKETYKTEGKMLTKFDMNNNLVMLKKEHPEYLQLYSQVLQNICDRVAKAYSNFFKRAKRKKAGERIKVGFPRFKKQTKSLTYPQSGFEIEGKKLFLSKIGNISIILHRPMYGMIKTLAIKKHLSGKWFAIFSCQIAEQKLRTKGNETVGIDVGLTSFVAMSDGSKVRFPDFLAKSEMKLKKLQRRLSRKKKGSSNRRKARTRFACLHEKIENQRYDFLHKLSNSIVERYPLIAVEELKVQTMMQNNFLAKKISDASWKSFTAMLCYKAAKAGCKVMFVNPRNTTKMCSNCGNVKEMNLSERTYSCPVCSMQMDRDTNAAKNILSIAVSTAGSAGIHACEENASTLEPSSGASSLIEAGTILG
jgi:putative transposase